MLDDEGDSADDSEVKVVNLNNPIFATENNIGENGSYDLKDIAGQLGGHQLHQRGPRYGGRKVYTQQVNM